MNLSYKNIISYVWARDPEKTINFYTAILGFKKAFESDGWTELAVPGTTNTYLAVNKWSKEGTYPVNEFLTLGIDDLNAFKAHLEAEEVTLFGDIVEFPEQDMRMLKFYDPDKNILTVSEVK